MARRNRDLAGLAALGALGYAMFGGDRNKVRPDGGAPVEDRSTAVRQQAAQAAAAQAAGFEDTRGLESGIEPLGLRRSEEGDLYDPTGEVFGRPTAPARESVAGGEPVRYVESPSRGRRAAPPRRNVAGDYTRKMGTTAEGMAAYRKQEYTPPLMTAEMRKQAEAQALERVTPEEYLLGGPGLKGLHSAAKALANRSPALREVTQQALPAPTPRLTGPSKADLMARDRAAREAARREEMLQENAARYGLDPRAPGYEGAARALREKLGDSAFTLKKKGGMVKAKAKKMASGGSTSSASKRADGIATKGKTKCKMY